MSEKKHELYLIALALIIAAGLILYNVFKTPELNAAMVHEDIPSVSTETYSTETELSQSETLPVTAENATKLQSETTKPTAVHVEDNAPKPAGKININSATKEQLMTLSGIGEVKASAILEYRKENGDFKSIEDLNNVKGIGDKIIEKIRAYVTV